MRGGIVMKICPNCGLQAEQEFRFCPSCGTKAPAGGVTQDSLIGKTLKDKYRIESEIGSGAMGTVYLGEHIGLRKKIALKVLHSDMQVSEESIRRFQREGIAAGKFDHVNAIQIFDFDTGKLADRAVFFLAMEFVEGSNLKVFLRQRGRLEIEESLSITRQVLSALAEAHRHGIVHRDLKPDNIMVTPASDGKLRVKVLDFGLSKLIDRKVEGSMQTQVGRVLGTPLYMAPEQCAGEETDFRIDIYAVGLILYEMLSGLTPFPDESTTEILFTRTTREAPSIRESHPNIGIPVDLDAILKRSMERRKEARYQSAEEMLAAIDSIRFDVLGAVTARRPLPDVGGSGKRSKGPQPGADGQPRPGSRKGVLIGLVVLVALALGSAGWFFLAGGGGLGIPAEAPARVSLVPRAERNVEENRYVDLLEETRRKLRSAQPDLAMLAIGDAMSLACRDSEAYLVRAEIHRQRGELEAAELDFEEALAMDPNYAQALSGQGWLKLDQDKLRTATELFRKAEECDPHAAEALAGLGAVAYLNAVYDQARELLLRVTRENPDYAPAHRYLGLTYLAEKDYDAAADALLQAKRRESSSETSAALGRVRLAQGRTADAEKEFREAVNHDPAAEDVRIEYATILIEQERYADASSELLSALRRNSDSPELNVLLGVVHQAQGDRPQAIRTLERALQIRAEDPEALILLGLLLQSEDRHAEALERFERALDLEGERVASLLGLGLSLFQLRRLEEARDRLEEVLLLDDDVAAAHYLLGILNMDYFGDNESAAEHLARYRQLDGSDRRVADWLARLR